MPVGFAIAGSAVLGYVASSNATDAASDAAAASTAQARDAAQLQYDLGKETLDFQRQYYADTLKPMQERDMALREQLQAELLPSLRQQRQFADEQNQYYKDTFQPLERQMVEDAQGYDSDANVNRRMGIAAGAVNQQFSNAQQQGARALARYGVNPNSSAFARENAKLTTAQALGTAGAQTGAAFDTIDKGIALRAGAANFGRNMPNTAANYYGLGNSTAGTSAGVSAGGIGAAGSAVAPMLSGSQIASGAFRGAGATLNDTFTNQMRMFQAQQTGTAGLFSGIGNLASTRWGQQGLQNMGNTVSGWFGSGNNFNINPNSGEFMGSLEFADGGPVHGPGGPRDDKVPAMLSRGEFVLNEGAVKHFGLARLNKMNEVGLQNQEARGLIRRS